MIFCNRDRASAKGLDRAGTIEPSWGDKSIDPATDHVFDKASAADDPLHRVLATKPKKFALARGHEPGTKSLAGSKMASAGADWQTNPATQIEWGLGYIRDSYGSPCGAWSFKQGHGWY